MMPRRHSDTRFDEMILRPPPQWGIGSRQQKQQLRGHDISARNIQAQTPHNSTQRNHARARGSLTISNLKPHSRLTITFQKPPWPRPPHREGRRRLVLLMGPHY